MRLKFPKGESQMRKLIVPLTQNHLFSRAYSRGKCETTKLVAVYLLKNYKKTPDGAPPRTTLGITVNRKLGKACKRNRVKRIIREAYRENYRFIKDGYIIVIAARSAAFAPHVGTKDISDSLHRIFSKEDFFDLKNTGKKNIPPHSGVGKEPQQKHGK